MREDSNRGIYSEQVPERESKMEDQKKRTPGEEYFLSPFWLTRFINRFHFLFIIGAIIIFLVGNILLYTREAYVAKNAHTFAPLSRNSRAAQEFIGVYAAGEDLEESNQDINTPVQSQAIMNWMVVLLFKYKGGDNLLTVPNLLKIGEYQEEFKRINNYGKFCLLSPNPVDPTGNHICNTMGQVTNFFPNLTQQNQDTINTLVKGYIQLPQTSIFFSKETTALDPRSKLTMSMYQFGSPIDWDGTRYKDKTDDYLDQEETFQEEFTTDVFEWAENTEGNDIEIYPSGMSLLLHEVLKVITSDIVWVFLSLMFIFFYNWLHLESLFLALWSYFHIFTCIPPSVLIVRDVFCFRMYGPSEIVITYLFIGVFCDSMFYMKDFWTHSRDLFPNAKDHPEHEKKYLEMRMAFMWKHTISPITVTHVVIGICFFASMFTPLMVVASPAGFALVCLLFNYFMIILVFPSILSMHEQYIKYNCFTVYHLYKYLLCCCCGSHTKNMETNADHHKNTQARNRDQRLESDSERENQEMERSDADYVRKGKTIIPAKNGFGWMDHFFELYYSRAIYYLKYPIVIIFLLWIGVNACLAEGMDPLESELKYMDEDHYIQKSFSMLQDYKSLPTQYSVQVYLVWGVKDLDESDNNYWDSYDIGEPVWDDDFQLAGGTTTVKQSRFLEICNIVQASPLVLNDSSAVECPMLAFKTWLGSQQPPIAFPVPDKLFMPLLINFTRMDPVGMKMTKDFLIGLEKQEDGISYKLKMMKIKAASVCKIQDSWEKFRSHRDEWEDMKDEINKRSMAGFNKMIEVAYEWAYMYDSEEYIFVAFLGLVVCSAFALLLGLVLTANLIIAFYCFVSTCGCLACIYGMMKLGGYTVAPLEINALFCILWFPLTYPLKMGYEYCNYRKRQTYGIEGERYYRTKHVLKHCGLFTFGGNIAMFLGVLPLFICELLFFHDTGAIAAFSLAYSFGFSLIFFPALLMAMGPTEDIGDVKALLDKIRGTAVRKPIK